MSGPCGSTWPSWSCTGSSICSRRPRSGFSRCRGRRPSGLRICLPLVGQVRGHALRLRPDHVHQAWCSCSPGSEGRHTGWWLASTIIQGWHLIEHSTLQIQAIVGRQPVRVSGSRPASSTSLPHPKLPLVYNLIVFIPMIVAMWLHTRPSQDALNDCNCAAPPVERAKAGLASV